MTQTQDLEPAFKRLRHALKTGIVTKEQIAEACERSMVSLDNPGICLSCGEEADGCEPDARNYECEHCGEKQVFGAEELMMMIG